MIPPLRHDGRRLLSTRKRFLCESRRGGAAAACPARRLSPRSKRARASPPPRTGYACLAHLAVFRFRLTRPRDGVGIEMDGRGQENTPGIKASTNLGQREEGYGSSRSGGSMLCKKILQRHSPIASPGRRQTQKTNQREKQRLFSGHSFYWKQSRGLETEAENGRLFVHTSKPEIEKSGSIVTVPSSSFPPA